MASTLPNAPSAASRSRSEMTRWIKGAVRAEGFDEVGVAPTAFGLGGERLEQWLAEGRQGDMAYMADRFDARRDPNRVLDGVKSVLVAALNYKGDDPSPPRSGDGRMSRYAWG